jgi:hypothetical protein
VIPSLGNMGPVLELRRMPKSTSLIIGHDGEGGFCLWYALVSQFCHLCIVQCQRELLQSLVMW